MEDEPLPRCEADPEAPLLPAHLVPGDIEAGAVRLHDFERLQVVAQRPDLVVAVCAGGGGHWHIAGVLDAQHLHAVQIDDRDTAPRSAARRRCPAGSRGTSTASMRAAGLLLRRLGVGTQCPRLRHHVLRLVDAARGERRAESRIGTDCLFTLGVLVERDRRLDAGDRVP